MNVHKVTKPAPPPIHTAETRGGGWRGWTIVLAMSLLITTILATSERRGFLMKSDMLGYDLLVKLQGKAPVSKNIVFVDFDEAALDALQTALLPRRVLAEVVAKISEGNPEVIGLDVLLDLPRADAEGDTQLADAIEKATNVVIIGEHGFHDHPEHEPLPVFEKAALNVGYADIPLEDDGSVRRMFLTPVLTSAGRRRLPLPVVLATYFSERHLKTGGPGYLLFGSDRLGYKQVSLATTEGDTAWIQFHRSPPVEDIPVLTVLKPDFDLSRFKGKIVMIGQTSEKGRDLVETPVTRAGVAVGIRRSMLCGTEVFAAATDTLLNDETRRTVHGGPRWILGLVLGFLVAACGYQYRWFISVGIAALLFIGVFGLALYLFTYKHSWMPFVSTEVGLVLALPAGLGYRSVEERHLKRLMEAERGQIMGLFERYVSPDVAAEIWKRRDQIVLGGEERVATIFFSDIRSFTAMTCGVPSHEVLSWLNRYLTAMGEVIKKNRGFLNKFIGDGIMVVFGAPLSEGPKDDACRAVRCALEMLVRLDEWNANLKPGEHPLKIGIGIHTGPVTAGNVGSPDRLEYSVIGEAVNLASRLEALTKEFKTPIVISPATWEYIRGVFPTVSLGEKEVRGFTTAIPLYSVETHSPVEVHS